MLRAQHFYHICGPYEVVGRRGEVFFVDNIVELFSASTMPLFRVLFSQGLTDTERQILILETVSDDRLQELITQVDARSGEPVALLRCLIDKMLEGVDENPSVLYCIGYYRINHVAIKAFHHLPFREFCRLLFYIADGNISLAKRVFERSRQSSHSTHSINFGSSVFRRSRRRVRHMATTSERRQNSAHIVEHGEFVVRGARRGIPDSRQDYWRRNPGNWKDSTKNKKQWMKNKKQ